MGKSVTNAEATQPTQTNQSAGTQPSQAVRVGPTRSRSSLRNWVVIITILFMFLGIIVAIVLPLAIYGYYQFYGLIIPGVHIGELDLAGLSWQEAHEGLELIYGQDPTLKITDGDRTWEIPTSHFGLGWNVDATTQLALNFGHGKDFQAETSEMMEGFLYGYEIEPIFTFDSEVALAAMEELGSSVDFPPVDADLRIEGGEVIIYPAASGASLNFEASYAQLAEDPLAVYQNGSLLLVLDPVEPAISDVSAAASEAERLLRTEITLHGYNPVLDQSVEWVVDKETIASWIIVERAETEFLVSIDEGAIDEFVLGMDESLGPDKYVDHSAALSGITDAFQNGSETTLRIYHEPTSYLVKPGDTLLEIGWETGFPYWMILDANPYLYSSSLQTGQELVIPSMDELLPLPVVQGKRIVLSISEQRLWTYEDGELLSEHIISTGIDRSPTQPGIFQVQTHELEAYASIWDLTMPHFLGIYESWPGFMNGIHGLPMLSNGTRLWKEILGRPASYGCIILDLPDAEWLYGWAEEGVVVEIQE